MAYCERGTVSISRAENGYTLTARDPKIEEQNAKRSLDTKNRSKPYIDPTKTYVFEDFASLSEFLEKNLEKALPKEDYVSAFTALGGDID